MIELEHAKWMEYKGKKIFYSDYRNLYGEDYINAIDENIHYALSLGEKNLLFITDIRGSIINSDVSNKLKRISEQIKSVTDKMALIGITGLKKVFFNALNRLTNMESKAFNDLEEAKEWLVS